MRSVICAVALLVVSILPSFCQSLLSKELVGKYRTMSDEHAFVPYKSFEEYPKYAEVFRDALPSLSTDELTLVGLWREVQELEHPDPSSWRVWNNGTEMFFLPGHVLYANYRHLPTSFPVYCYVGEWRVSENRLIVGNLWWLYTSDSTVTGGARMHSSAGGVARTNYVSSSIEVERSLVGEWFPICDNVNKIDRQYGYLVGGLRQIPMPASVLGGREFDLALDRLRFIDYSEERDYRRWPLLFLAKLIDSTNLGGQHADLEQLAWFSRFW